MLTFDFPANRFPSFEKELDPLTPHEEYGPRLRFDPRAPDYLESGLELHQPHCAFQPTREEIRKKRMEIVYSFVDDVYLQSGVKLSPSLWQNSVWRFYNLARKEEYDWKMGYLARVDRSPDENHFDGLLEYRFNLKDTGMTVKSLHLRLPHKTYQEAKVRVSVCSKDDYSVVLDTQELNLVVRATGWDDFVIRIELSGRGGEGGCSYQTAQLFRQPLQPSQPISPDWKEPFKVVIEMEAKEHDPVG